jgi:hypothetical protein
MSRGRSFVWTAALVLCLTACAAMQNTPGQDVAQDAWNSCPKAVNIRLDRIDVDGHIYYTGLNGSAGMSELGACIQAYYAKRAGRTQ